MIYTALTSRRLKGSSLFNRLFVVVAVTAGFFSAVSSAIGFGLITSQESDDFFRNAILPPAFGVFVFCLAVAIWVGGAEFVRHRDWFRGVTNGFLADILFFFERAVKLFIVVPLLATILFFVSTWTTVVGVGGVDAVRLTYSSEIDRLAAECAGITAWRQRDFLFLEDLRLSVNDVTRVADSERLGGAQSGAAGAGAVTDYFIGLADWYRGLEESVAAIIAAPDPSGADPYDPAICSAKADELKLLLSRGAYDNVDRWNREFETAFNDFASVLNRWRHDKRIERLLDQQLANFARANPQPVGARITAGQRAAIERYAGDVEGALKSLISRQKRAKPAPPIKYAAELSPARGLDIFRDRESNLVDVSRLVLEEVHRIAETPDFEGARPRHFPRDLQPARRAGRTGNGLSRAVGRRCGVHSRALDTDPARRRAETRQHFFRRVGAGDFVGLRALHPDAGVSVFPERGTGARV